MEKRLKIFAKLVLMLSVLSLVVGASIPKNDPDITLKIRTYLNTFRINYAPEKVYIHQDKNLYVAGELIWLKGYILDAASLLPTQKSAVLHLELRNDREETVMKATLPIEDGMAIGDMQLGESLPAGTYFLVAYTQWMRNFGSKDMFQRELQVLQKKGEVQTEASPSGLPDLQFFPEGGHLLAGQTQEVAFKAVGPDGKGLSVKGQVFDQDGNEVVGFEDFHQGMGSFQLAPKAGTRYHALIIEPVHLQQRYPFPDPIEKGILLQVDENSDNEHILINLHSLNAGSQNLSLLAIAGDNLVKATDVFVEESRKVSLSLVKNDFPIGVASLVLIDRQGVPLAERLLYIEKEEPAMISIGMDQSNLDFRELVNLQLTHTGSEPAEKLDLSVAVISEDQAGFHSEQENIKTYLLLSSDLKGHIENPYYYFDPANADRKKALRYLMMTQGWRRFEWNTLLEQRLPEIRHSSEMDLQLWGRLTQENGKGIDRGEALLFLQDRYQSFITTESNQQGYFAFQGFYFRDTIDLVIQGSDRRGNRSGVQVEIIDHLSGLEPPIYTLRLPTGKITDIPGNYISTMQYQFQASESALSGIALREIMLDEVVVEGRAEVNEPFRLHRRADATFTREQLPIAPSGNILESLQGRVAGLQIIPKGGFEFRAVIRGQGSPLFLLDGVMISESAVQGISQFDISRVEILKGPGSAGIYGGQASGGVIALYTRRGGEDTEIDPDSGRHIIRYRMGGFTRARQFYVPKYDGSEGGYYQFPDLRTTIHWEPSVRLEANARQTLSFFTADTPGTYRVIVQGISDKGSPVYATHSFQVGN
ncbi:hypothetical protein ADIS_1217 [Lunatimonas lonarensis]|uniref:TonB-dependent receptor plug domain-containing protein n=2 Tax=Lunatimonas lonarensis TaxID=1232681 RepID=R7ZWH2_9BACT|nr:hypothetical protein ADIS_1217 [Lunatimonas lonarensis]